MELSAKELANLLGGRIEGNEDVRVNTLAKIEEGKPKAVSFLANPNYIEYVYQTQASIVIVSNEFKAEKPLVHNPTLIYVEDPRLSFAKILEAYSAQMKPSPKISEHASIASSASIGKNVFIGDFVSIGENATIGDNCILYPHAHVGKNAKLGNQSTLHTGAKILENCIVGEDCVLQAGAIIGGDGFGFAPNSENNYQKVIHIGNVILEDHVEIGANTTIDRATLGSTIIRKGVKLDNLIQIAHNVEIGENTVMAAQTGIAGSTKIGKNCMIGGQVGIVGHIEIADEVKIAAQSGISQSIKEKGSIVQGSPAFAIGDYKRAFVLFKNLPKLKQQLDNLMGKLSNVD